jgi:cytochrome c biogenesis protein CcmG, thiol:disulfide interchange protein DsbE
VVDAVIRVHTGLKAVVGAAMILFFVVLGWSLLTAGRGQSLVDRIASGAKPPAPGFALPVIWPRASTWPPALRTALTDGRLGLDELHGMPVVINFWASWCGPCRSEIPLFVKAAAREHRNVAFVGIDVQDLTGDAVRFLPRFHVDYVAVRDGGDGTYREYGLTGVPETFFLDRTGRIVAHVPGVVDEGALERGLAAIH